jgi:hypothetical protein
MWFEVKVKYDKMEQDGIVRKAMEVYLVDAMSHAEAELRTVKELEALSSGDFGIASVRRMNIAEAFLGEGDRIFRCKVNLISLDEKTGRERIKGFTILQQASSFDEALSAIHAGMKETLSDYEVKSLIETPIKDVLYYST